MRKENCNHLYDAAASVLKELDIPESKDPFLHPPGPVQDAPGVDWLRAYATAITEEHPVSVSEAVDHIKTAFHDRYSISIDEYAHQYDEHYTDRVGQLHLPTFWLDQNDGTYQLVKDGKCLAAIHPTNSPDTHDLIIEPEAQRDEHPGNLRTVMEIAEKEFGLPHSSTLRTAMELLNVKSQLLDRISQEKRREESLATVLQKPDQSAARSHDDIDSDRER